MTTIDEYREKIRDAFPLGGGLSEDADLHRLLEVLGLTVEDPKPEPGLYIFGGRFPVVIDGDGDWWNLTLGGDPGMAYEDTPGDPKHLTPARVVPAEPTLPTPLTEEQVGELWDKVTTSGVADWMDYRTPRRVSIQRTVNAALAKYGRGTHTPSREDVYEAIKAVASGYVVGVNIATDAVLALLEGGKA